MRVQLGRFHPAIHLGLGARDGTTRWIIVITKEKKTCRFFTIHLGQCGVLDD